MAALNYQARDRPLMFSRAMFRQNGRAGYVLKPRFLRGKKARSAIAISVFFALLPLRFGKRGGVRHKISSSCALLVLWEIVAVGDCCNFLSLESSPVASTYNLLFLWPTKCNLRKFLTVLRRWPSVAAPPRSQPTKIFCRQNKNLRTI